MGPLNGSTGGGYWNESQLDDYMNHNSTSLSYNGVFPKIIFSIVLLGSLGNFITIVYVTFTKQLHTPTFLAIGSLAITDLTVCMISLIFLLPVVKNNFFFHSILQSVLRIILSIAMVKSSCDVVFLFSLRYALIVHPLNCRQYLTNSFVISASLTFWGYSLIINVLVLLIQFSIYNMNIDNYENHFIGTAITIIIVTVLPVTIMSVLHCLKMRKLRSTTVNTAMTRRMSFIIIIFVVLNMIFGILFYVMVDIDIIGLMHSINPFIFFIFHVPYRKCVSIVTFTKMK